MNDIHIAEIIHACSDIVGKTQQSIGREIVPVDRKVALQWTVLDELHDQTQFRVRQNGQDLHDIWMCESLRGEKKEGEKEVQLCICQLTHYSLRVITQ